MDEDFSKRVEEIFKKRQDRLDFLTHITPSEINSIDDLNAAELIGIFVVHEQLLEESIKQLLDTIYSYKAAASNGKFTILRQDDFSGLTLGKLHGKLLKVLFHQTIAPQTQVDILEELKKKLKKFNETRNDYIHRLLQQDLKVDEFKKKILQAIAELSELVEIVNDVRIKINKHYDYDGNSLLSIAGHLIAKNATKKG